MTTVSLPTRAGHVFSMAAARRDAILRTRVDQLKLDDPAPRRPRRLSGHDMGRLHGARAGHLRSHRARDSLAVHMRPVWPT
jgi:hypothetical protein